MNPKLSQKEVGLLKGALRRIFSRSLLRKQAIANYIIKPFTHPEHTRVTKWAYCGSCGIILPAYKVQVDHINPVVPIGTSVHSMTIDDLISRIWCDISNLDVLCKPCHQDKSKAENKARRSLKGTI